MLSPNFSQCELFKFKSNIYIVVVIFVVTMILLSNNSYAFMYCREGGSDFVLLFYFNIVLCMYICLFLIPL